MIKLVNRGLRKLSDFFTSRKLQSEKCRQCSVIKPGGLSPAIVFSERNIDHDECNIGCGIDRKFTFIIFRLILIGLVLYIIYRYGIIATEFAKYYFS